MKALREKVLFQKKNDGNDAERDCYNQIMEKKIVEGKQGIVQELYLPGKGGTYYGVNQVSRNILFGNRKRLVNGNGFIFGVPGSGKLYQLSPKTCDSISE